MMEELARLVAKYSNNNRLADEKFVLKTENIIRNTKGYKYVINGISFNKMRKIGFYDYGTKTIYLNSNLYKYARAFKFLEHTSDPFKYNMALVIAIFHELDHAVLFDDMNKGKFDLMAKLSMVCDFYDSLSIKDPDKSLSDRFRDFKERYKIRKLYSDYHDFAPYETRAIHTSFEETFEINKKLYNFNMDPDRIMDFKNIMYEMKDDEMYKRYTCFQNGISESASYDYCMALDFRSEYFPEELLLYKESPLKAYEEDSKNYSFEERVKLGLQISEDEFSDYFSKRNTDCIKMRTLK